MNVTWRYIFGIGTMVGIIGLTVYAIKKSKDLQNAEENAISFEDAYGEFEERMMKCDSELIDDKEMEEVIDDIRDVASYNRSFAPYPDEEEEELYYDSEIEKAEETLEDDEDYEVAEEVEEEAVEEAVEENPDKSYEEVAHELYPSGTTVGDLMKEYVEEDIVVTEEIYEELNTKKEEKKLMYAPNSGEARAQFIRMELSDWSPKEKSCGTLLRLFEFPFRPMNDGDEDLRTKIIDYRAQFFGFSSRWTQEVTYADVILYFARLAVYNVDEDIKYWVNAFLDFNELDEHEPSHKIDQTLEALNAHVYHNKFHDSYGLFGLTQEAMTNAIRIADRNIDRSLTYEIEFNEFLKMCM